MSRIPPVSARRDLACGPDDNRYFYSEDLPARRRRRSRKRPRRTPDEAYALSLCGRCPAAEECLAWALQTREPYGIWGGKTANQRQRMLTALKTTTGKAS